MYLSKFVTLLADLYCTMHSNNIQFNETSFQHQRESQIVQRLFAVLHSTDDTLKMMPRLRGVKFSPAVNGIQKRCSCPWLYTSIGQCHIRLLFCMTFYPIQIRVMEFHSSQQHYEIDFHLLGFKRCKKQLALFTHHYRLIISFPYSSSKLALSLLTEIQHYEDQILNNLKNKGQNYLDFFQKSPLMFTIGKIYQFKILCVTLDEHLA